MPCSLQVYLSFLIMMMEAYIMRLVFVLSMCLVLSGSADAVKFSQATKRIAERMTAAAQKIATPVKQGVIIMACASMFCGYDIYDREEGWFKFNQGAGALAGAHRESLNSVGLETEFILFENGDRWDYSFGHVDVNVASDGNSLHFPHAHFHAYYTNSPPPYPLSYARGEGLRDGWSLGGYERHDFRTHGFDNGETEGFVAQYLHFVGMSTAGTPLWRPGFPVFKTSLGILGFNFRQADLTEWGSKQAELVGQEVGVEMELEPGFGAWLWSHNSLRWRSLSLWEGLRANPKKNLPPPSVDFGIKVEQLRSISGGISYSDADDKSTLAVAGGDFTAIWEAITADIVWTIYSSDHDRPYQEWILNLVFEGYWYRQRLNAKSRGRTFNQNDMGKGVELKIELRQ